MRSVGLDIGSRTATLAVVNTGLKGVKVERVMTRPIGTGPEGILQAVTLLKAACPLRHAPVAISVPVHTVSSRLVTLPFALRSKLEAVLPSELEGQIPFELDDVVIDFFTVTQEPDRAHVLAAALPKSTLRSRLDELARAGIDPRVVTVDAVALASASTTWLPATRNAALVHLDDAWASVGLLHDGKLHAMRGIWSHAEATTSPLPEARALQPVVTELGRTLRAYAAESGHIIEALALSGHGVERPDVMATFTESLGLELLSWPRVSVGGVEESLAPAAVALGLAVAGANGNPGLIDFRRGEFVYGRERAGLRRRLITVGAMVATVLVAGGADLVTRLTLKEHRYRAVQEQVRASFREVLPGVTTVVNEADQLQAAIDTLNKQRAFLGGEVGGLGVLLALTDAIPKESAIKISDLTIDQDKVRIEAETISFEWVNKIESALSKSPLIKAITVSDAKTTADQSKIRFLMTVTLMEGV